jgi:hypothetical protein
MLVKATKTLLTRLGIKNPQTAPETDQFHFQASLATVPGHQGVIFFHELSRYPIVLWDLSEGDFSKLDSLFFQSILKTWPAEDGIEAKAVEAFLAQSPGLEWYRATDMSAVAKQNHGVRNALGIMRLNWSYSTGHKGIQEGVNRIVAAQPVAIFNGACMAPKDALADVFSPEGLERLLTPSQPQAKRPSQGAGSAGNAQDTFNVFMKFLRAGLKDLEEPSDSDEDDEEDDYGEEEIWLPPSMLGGKKKKSSGGSALKMLRDLGISPLKPVPRQAFRFKINLRMCKGFNCWRRLVVPGNFTFSDFHYAIQGAFGWNNCHLYNFEVYDGFGREPVLRLGGKREDMFYIDDDDDTLDSRELTLGQLLPDYARGLSYLYDFGDSWDHSIRLEKILDDYSGDCVCLKGVGDSPPEDVGGQWGFADFLKIINDPKHPEYEEMTEWGDMQGYEPFDIDIVNRRLKHISAGDS